MRRVLRCTKVSQQTDAVGQSRHIERAPTTSALVPISRHLEAAQYLSKRARALNRCAIARCAGSPTASAVTGMEIIDSICGVLS